jgi:hypothetical protein
MLIPDALVLALVTGKEKSIGMRKITKLALVALIAVMSLAALVAASVASAGEPKFLTGSGATLLFTADSGLGTLRGEVATVLATVTCAQDLTHGVILNNSPLAHKVEVAFEGKCEQVVGSEKTACTEPITTKALSGELGLLNGEVLLLLTPESGNFTTLHCGSTETAVGGAVIGLVDPPYGVAVTDATLLFKASGTKQLPEEIELLGVLMTKDSLHVSGLFGGGASEETTELLLPDGPVTIDP